MNWVTTLWPMMAGACLTLGIVHLLIWLRRDASIAHLWFYMFAVSVTCYAGFELAMMHAQTVEEFRPLQRWLQIAVFVLVVSTIWFVRSFFQTGRRWLAWSVVDLRVLVLALNFISPQSINYLEISSLQWVELWGGVSVPVARGTVNPWNALAGFSYVLFGVFVADASIQLWRRKTRVDRRRAVLIGGSLSLLVFLSAAVVVPTHMGFLTFPYALTFLVLGPLFAMGYELGADVFRATQLALQVEAGEAQVRENAERLALALKGARLALWDWDLVSGNVYLSGRWQEMLGGPAEAMTTTFAELAAMVHPDDFPALRRNLRDALKGSAPAYEVDHRVRQPAGDWIWIHTRGEVVARDAAGRAARMAGVNEDITVRKLAEAEAEQRRTELAHLSRVAMLGELSGALAHELNQPLTAILSNAQAAQRFLAAGVQHVDEVKEILDDIVEDDKRAGAVIRGLRVLLKKEEVTHHQLELNGVALDVLRLMRSDLVNRNVRWSTQLCPGLPLVLGDGIQLQQVLLNLVMNGCDAMAGNVGEDRRLEVRTARGEDGSVIASVSDRGRGIPPQDLERIFEPFVTTKAHGMGLGLSVCRTIVHAHGGRIWAVNNASSGVTVSVALPAQPEPAA
jgi:two-component system, LuxR family, sensor kinase FixL